MITTLIACLAGYWMGKALETKLGPPTPFFYLLSGSIFFIHLLWTLLT